MSLESLLEGVSASVSELRRQMYMPHNAGKARRNVIGGETAPADESSALRLDTIKTMAQVSTHSKLIVRFTVFCSSE
jgi:hypothetical protein